MGSASSMVGADSSTIRRAGRYTNWRVLGEGGTATVHRVYDNELSCDVAIKVLKPEVLASAENRVTMVETLRKEVKISRMLRHQYICAIHDLYDGPQGFGTIMDLIDGQELRKWMNMHLNEFYQTAPARLSLLTKLVEALSVAHNTGPGIVHRDLKPQNIFLKGGEISFPIIMDFGFSVMGQRVSHSNVSGFTPKYMAPEQLEAPDEVDQRADLFALGIMAYELFTGEIPPTSCKDILKTRRPPRIPIDMITPPSRFNEAVKPALDRVIVQLMAYEPERRIQSAAELLDVLRNPDELLWKPGGIGPRPVPGPIERAAEARDIEGGEYYLGSRKSKITRPNELPGVKVKLTPFRIDPHLVTNRDYLEFVKRTGRAKPPLAGRRGFDDPEQPVVGITFEEACDYAAWVGGFLPSEAQWECAARGGTMFALFPWGNEPAPGASNANIGDYRQTPTQVGSFLPNEFGLYDMCGNVWEWCQDAYDDNFFRTISAGTTNPMNAKQAPGAPRSLRGGSYQSLATNGRCAFRSSAKPDERRSDIGFRVAYRTR